jgi:hypothetical protein
MSKLSVWLEKEFLEWQYKSGGPQAWNSFAAFLDINPTTFSTYRNTPDPNPHEENVLKMAIKLGDEVYDILGRPKPDLRLLRIEATMKRLPPESYEALINVIEDQLEKEIKRHLNHERT